MARRYMTLPTCFGKQWDSEAAECAGGRDENYFDPKTNSRIRARCEFFTSCGARIGAAKQPELIPAQQLLRPPFRAAPQPSFRSPLSQPTAPPMAQQATTQQAVAQQQLQLQVQQLTQQLQSATQELNVRRTGQQGYYPVQQAPYIPPPMAMPPYLAVPEPRTRGTSTLGRLGREMLRASMKAAGHQLASFWDVNPIGRSSDDDGSG